MMIDNTNTQHALELMGWQPHFNNQLPTEPGEGLFPARIIGVGKNLFHASNGQHQWLASVSGRLTRNPDSPRPVTGDWVLMRDQVIFKILDRRNVLSRGAAGSRTHQKAGAAKSQIIAANLDIVFVVAGLDRDFNLRRIERTLTLVYNCGLTPVIILTKADLHADPSVFTREVETVAFGVPVHLVSADDDHSLETLAPYLKTGQTTAMIGSSGAGKSTLINRLCGKTVQTTGAVSAQVGKGKHTTTSRDLIMMPQGGMVIDNPGIREISLWEGNEGAPSAFPDIERLAQGCRFSDCSHEHEPGCRVLEAVQQGDISCHRLENFRKMEREMAYLSLRRSKSADRVEKERWKGVALKIKAINRQR